MRVLNIHGINDVRLDPVDPPRPGSKDVVVKVKAGTDVAAVAEQLANDERLPMRTLTERDHFRTQGLGARHPFLPLAGIIAGLLVAALLIVVVTSWWASASRSRQPGVHAA